MALGNTLNILRPPEQATMPVQTKWNEDLVKNMHVVLGEMSQQLKATSSVSTAALTNYATKALLEAATVPLVVTSIQLTGYTSDGDGGGALYVRAAAEPSHTLKIQSRDTAWWELVPDLAGLDLKQAGCVVDGTTDDTTAFQGAAAYAADNGITLRFPAGECLLTDGFATTTDQEIIRWVGHGRTAQNAAAVDISRIRFAPTATTKYLIDQGHITRISISDMVIQGVDPVDGGELKLFRFNATGAQHQFREVDFEGNHHWSVYYDTSCYFQNASFTDVQFRACGTIGSQGTGLKATLLNLNNVNHESTIPVNTQKVVMDLRGVRVIAGTNVLLEGALPSDGDWIVLRIDHGAVVAGITNQEIGCSFNGFWSEWTGNNPLYSASVNGTMCKFMMTTGLFTPNFGMFVDNGAVITIENAVFIGTSTVDFDAVAVFGDVNSKVIFRDCKLRSIESSSNPQISFIHCQNVEDDSRLGLSYELTTVDNEVLYEWNGGLLNDNSVITHPAVSQTRHLRTIVTDATYGRIINIADNGDSDPRWNVIVEVLPEWAGMTLMVEMYAHLSTLTGETFHQLRTDNLVNVALQNVVGDGTYRWYQLKVKLPAGSGGPITFRNNSNATGNSTDMKIAALRISLGDAHGRFPKLVKPTNVRSFASAAPTTGTWIVGDVVDNDTPAANGTMGFVCTTGGTPGTWKTFGVITA